MQFNQNLTNGKEALKSYAIVLRLTEQTSTAYTSQQLRTSNDNEIFLLLFDKSQIVMNSIPEKVRLTLKIKHIPFGSY